MNKEMLRSLRPLILILQYNDINVNIDNLVHQFLLQDKDSLSIKDYILICKSLNAKCKHYKLKESQLQDVKTPFIYFEKDNNTNIVLNVNDEAITIMDMNTEKPMMLSTEQFLKRWSGEVIQIKNKGFMTSQEKFNFSWFISAVLKYKSALVQVLIAYFTIQIIGLFTPMFIQFILDKVLSTGNISTLVVLSVMLFFALLIELLITLSKDYIFHHTTNRIDMVLNSKLMKHLFGLPLAYFEKRRAGDTIARVREVENIRSFITGTPMIGILDVLFVIVYIIIMFFYSSTLSFIVLAILPIIVIIYAFATPIFKKRLDKKYYAGAELQSFIVESLNGIHTIKSFALEPRMNNKWENIAAEYTDTGFKTNKLAFIINDTVSFLQKVQDIIVIAVGSILVIDNKLSIGELVAFRMIASRITSPILRFVQMWQDYQQVSLSVDRISDIFNNPLENQQGTEQSMDLPNIDGNIKFEDVCFRYNLDQQLVIKNLTFTIPTNRVVGLIGRSGSGKSTISKLVQRLYVPECGKIYLDDIDTSTVDSYWLRRQIGIVLQDNFIFNGTIRENIAINNPTISFEKIKEACIISGAHDFIVQMKEGYNTIIGERGTGLSGGQKQRLAIARALLLDPRILIFDEATSALDYESERIIQDNLKTICKNRTVIIIAHRLSTLKDCDYIMSIDNGQIIEYDRPNILLQKEHSFYRYLMNQQRREG